MQEYRDLSPTGYVNDDRETINKNFQSIISDFAGTAFPTENLIQGMKCDRTDQKKIYRLKNVETNQWVLIYDYNDEVEAVPKAISAISATNAKNATNAANATNDSEGNNIKDTYINQDQIGVRNGIASLDDKGQVPAEQLENAPQPDLSPFAKSVNDILVKDGNVDINRKFYNSLEQLGLEYTTVTFDAIVNAMPANSTLTFYVDVVTSYPTYAPNLSVPISGLVIVNKGGDSSVPIEFTICSIVKAYTTYTGKYTTYNSYGFSGWIPVINKVQGLPADINGNATMYKYQEWKYDGAYAQIDGFMITFAGGFSVLIWYFLFKRINNLTVNFPKAFLTPPATMGNGIALPDRAAYIKCNVANVTSTSCQVSHDSSGDVGTYFYSIGYSTF